MNTQDDFNVDAEERKKFTLEEAIDTFGVKKEDKTIEFDTMKDSLSEEEIQQTEAQRAIDLALKNPDGTYGSKDAENYNYGDYTADNTLQNLTEAGRMAVDVARYGLKAIDKLWGTGETGTPLKRAIDYLDESEESMKEFHKFTLNRQNEYQEKFGIMGRAGLFATDVFQNMYLDPSDYVYGAIVGANKFTKMAGRLPFIRFAYNTYDIYDKLPHQYGENEFQQLGAMVAMQLGMKGAGKLVSKALAKNIEFDSESSSADKRSFTDWVKDNMHYSEDLTNNLVHEHSKLNADKYEKMQEKGMLEIDHTYLATVQYRADNGLPLGVYNNHVLKAVEENSTDKIFEIYYKKIADYQKETGNYDIPSFEDFRSFVDGITNLPAGYRVGAIKDAIASGTLNEDVYAKAMYDTFGVKIKGEYYIQPYDYYGFVDKEKNKNSLNKLSKFLFADSEEERLDYVISKLNEYIEKEDIISFEEMFDQVIRASKRNNIDGSFGNKILDSSKEGYAEFKEFRRNLLFIIKSTKEDPDYLGRLKRGETIGDLNTNGKPLYNFSGKNKLSFVIGEELHNVQKLNLLERIFKRYDYYKNGEGFSDFNKYNYGAILDKLESYDDLDLYKDVILTKNTGLGVRVDNRIEKITLRSAEDSDVNYLNIAKSIIYSVDSNGNIDESLASYFYDRNYIKTAEIIKYLSESNMPDELKENLLDYNKYLNQMILYIEKNYSDNRVKRKVIDDLKNAIKTDAENVGVQGRIAILNQYLNRIQGDVYRNLAEDFAKEMQKQLGDIKNYKFRNEKNEIDFELVPEFNNKVKNIFLEVIDKKENYPIDSLEIIDESFPKILQEFGKISFKEVDRANIHKIPDADEKLFEDKSEFEYGTNIVKNYYAGRASYFSFSKDDILKGRFDAEEYTPKYKKFIEHIFNLIEKTNDEDALYFENTGWDHTVRGVYKQSNGKWKVSISKFNYDISNTGEYDTKEEAVKSVLHSLEIVRDGGAPYSYEMGTREWLTNLMKVMEFGGGTDKHSMLQYFINKMDEQFSKFYGDKHKVELIKEKYLGRIADIYGKGSEEYRKAELNARMATLHPDGRKKHTRHITEAIQYYNNGEHFHDFNMKFIENKISDMNYGERDTYNAFKDWFSSDDSILDSTMTFFRGARTERETEGSWFDDIMKNVKAGDVLPMKGYLSVSHTPNISAHFARSEAENRNITSFMMIIEAPKGSRVLPFGLSANSTEENELLLNKDSKFFVKEVEELPYQGRIIKLVKAKLLDGEYKDAVIHNSDKPYYHLDSGNQMYIERVLEKGDFKENFEFEINNLKVKPELEKDLKNVLDLYKDVSYMRRLQKASEKLYEYANNYLTVQEAKEIMKDDEMLDLFKDLKIDLSVIEKITPEQVLEVTKTFENIKKELAGLEKKYGIEYSLNFVNLLKEDFFNNKPSDLKEFSKKLEDLISKFKDPKQQEKFLKKYSAYAKSFNKLVKYLEEDYKNVVEDAELKNQISDYKNLLPLEKFKENLFRETYTMKGTIDKVYEKILNKFILDNFGEDFSNNKNGEGTEEFAYIMSKPELKKIIELVNPYITFSSSNKMRIANQAGMTITLEGAKNSYIVIGDIGAKGVHLNFEADKPFTIYSVNTQVDVIMHELGHAVQNFIDSDRTLIVKRFSEMFEEQLIKPLQTEEKKLGLSKLQHIDTKLATIDYLARYGTNRAGATSDFLKELSRSRFFNTFLSEYGVGSLKKENAKDFSELSKELFAELFARAYSPFTLVFDDETKNLLSNFRKIIDGELQKRAELDATTVDIDFKADSLSIGKIVYPTAMKNVFADYEKEFDYLYQSGDIKDDTKEIKKIEDELNLKYKDTTDMGNPSKREGSFIASKDGKIIIGGEGSFHAELEEELTKGDYKLQEKIESEGGAIFGIVEKKSLIFYVESALGDNSSKENILKFIEENKEKIKKNKNIDYVGITDADNDRGKITILFKTSETKTDSPLDKIKSDSEWMKNNHIDFASTSKGNSDRRLPKIYSELAEGRVPDIKPTDLILDFGAGEGWKGQYDLRKEAGIKNDVIPYDKYIEGINDWYKVEEEINKAKAEGRDIVIVSSNVLNVIPVKGIFGENLDKAYVEDTVKEIEDTANKYGAKVIVSVYEGDGAHKGTPQIMKKSYQSNMPLRFYTRFFEDKSKITIASSHIIYEPNKQPLYVPQDLSYGKVVGNNRYQYIGNNKVAVTDKKTGNLLFISTVDDWNKPEPVIVKMEYPNGKVKIPTLKGRQVYHSRELFMDPSLKDTELYKESEARTKKIDAELERIGVSKKAIGYEQKWLEYLKQMNLEEKKIEKDDFQISYYKMLNTEQPKPVHISGDIQKDYEASIKNLVNLTQRLVRGDKGIDVKNTVINNLNPVRFHLGNAVKTEAYGMKQGLWGDTKMLQILDPSKFEEIQTLGAKIVIDAIQNDTEIINPQFTKAIRMYFSEMVEYKAKEQGVTFEEGQYIMGIDTFYNKNKYQSQLYEFVKNPTPEMLEKMAGVLRPEHLESLKDENFRHTLYVDHTLVNRDKNNSSAMMDHATLADYYYNSRQDYVSMYEGMEKDIKDVMANILTGAIKNRIHFNILNEISSIAEAKHNNKDAFILASIDADTKNIINDEIADIQATVNKIIRDSIAPSKLNKKRTIVQNEEDKSLEKYEQNNGLAKLAENMLSWKFLSNLNYLAESSTNHREVYKGLRDMGFIGNGEYIARAYNGAEQYGDMFVDHLRFWANYRRIKKLELNKIQNIKSRIFAQVYLEKKMQNLKDYSKASKGTRIVAGLGEIGGSGQTFSDLERIALAEYKLFNIFGKGIQLKNENGNFKAIQNGLGITDEQLDLVRARLKGMDAEELYALLFEKSYSNDDVEHNIQRLWNNIISDVGKDFDSKARIDSVEEHIVTKMLLLYKRYSIRTLNKIARQNTTHTENDGTVINSLATNYEYLRENKALSLAENASDVTANIGYALNRVIGKSAITLLTGLIFRSPVYYQLKSQIKAFLEGDYFNVTMSATFNTLIDNTGITIALGSTRGTTPLGQFVQAPFQRIETGMRNGLSFGEASGYSAIATFAPEVISRSIDFYNLKKEMPVTVYGTNSELSKAWYQKYYRKIGEAEQQSSEGIVLPILLFLPRATGMLFEMMKEDVGLSQEASGIMDAEVDSELVASIATQNIVNASELARTEAILTLEESELEKLGISYKDEYNLLSEDIKPKWNRAMEYLQLEEKKKLLLLTKLNDFETEEEKLKFLKEQIPPSKLERLGLE